MSTNEHSYENIPTPCISDAMQGLNNMSPSIRPLNDHYALAGRALTVKMPIGDNHAVLRAIKEAKPGDVLVIDAKGDESRAVAGEFVVSMAKTLGIKGMIVDGVIRDLQGISVLNLPVFCRGTTVAASFKSGAGEINVPITCGGVPVLPGDIVVGDIDGVVVVPQSMEKEIFEMAKNKLERDEAREESVSGNPIAIRKYLNQVLSSS